MRSLFALLLLPAFAFAQTADEKKATLKFIDSLRDPETGAWAVSPPKDGEKLKPSLRAVNGAVNALKFFGGEVTDKEKVTKFVMGCYDEKTGTFAEPGEKPTVASTSVGVLSATALDIDKAKYKKTMEYLEKNAKTFEELRITAAAIEAFGPKESPYKPEDWAKKFSLEALAFTKKSGGRSYSYTHASIMAAFARLKLKDEEFMGNSTVIALNVVLINENQLKDGGWGKDTFSETSDADTTYRVMRALMLLKVKPNDPEAVAKFVASCRRKDGGYGVDATAPSSMSGVYYAAKITEWLK